MSSTDTPDETENENETDERTHHEKLKAVFQAIKPRGPENAIYAADVGKVADINDGDYNRSTRKLIDELIEEYDVPIASGNAGFFFLDDPNDLADYLSRLESTIEGTKERKVSVTQAYNRYKWAKKHNDEVGFEFTFDEDEEDVDDGFVLVDRTIEQVVEAGFETEAEAEGWASRFGFTSDSYEVRSAEEVDSE